MFDVQLQDITPKILTNIQKLVEGQLVKRGYHAPVTVRTADARSDRVFFTLSSEYFQTAPVIFKSLHISNGALGSITKDENGEMHFVLPVGVSCQYFGGSGNFVTLFTIAGTVSEISAQGTITAKS